LWAHFLIPGIAGAALFILLLIFIKSILGNLNRGVDSIYHNLRRLKEGKSLQRPVRGTPLAEIFPAMKEVEKGIAESRESELEREKVQKQMTEFLKIVNAAADGDFTVRADVTAGTFGALADSFNLMISDLSDLIRDVKKSAEQVSSVGKATLQLTLLFHQGQPLLPETASALLGVGISKCKTEACMIGKLTRGLFLI
jgi:methyl-accepting chemotaxis protein